MKNQFFRMCPKCQLFFQDAAAYFAHVEKCNGNGWPKESPRDAEKAAVPPRPAGEEQGDGDAVSPVDEKPVDEKSKSKTKK